MRFAILARWFNLPVCAVYIVNGVLPWSWFRSDTLRAYASWIALIVFSCKVCRSYWLPCSDRIADYTIATLTGRVCILRKDDVLFSTAALVIDIYHLSTNPFPFRFPARAFVFLNDKTDESVAKCVIQATNSTYSYCFVLIMRTLSLTLNSRNSRELFPFELIYMYTRYETLIVRHTLYTCFLRWKFKYSYLKIIRVFRIRYQCY